MNDYETYLNFDIESVLSDYNYVIKESNVDTIKQLIELYDKVTLDEWFEDDSIVDKSIPEFNFV